MRASIRPISKFIPDHHQLAMHYPNQVHESHIYYIVLFCGAGGETTGVHQATVNGIPAGQVVACVNHDGVAIEAHKIRHPWAVHLVEDIRDIKVIQILKNLVEEIRRNDPLAIIALQASLECTNFSNAKGGLSRDADSRSLADFMPYYIKALQPDIFMVENVREFMQWGPVIPKEVNLTYTWDKVKYHTTASMLEVSREGKGKNAPITVKPVLVPDKTKLATFYKPWVKSIKGLGYDYEHRLLNSADFGAPQSRLRFFGQFVREGLPLSWPVQTHNKKGTNGLQKWVAVKTVLDLNDKGEDIFQRIKFKRTEKAALAFLKTSKTRNMIYVIPQREVFHRYAGHVLRLTKKDVPTFNEQIQAFSKLNDNRKLVFYYFDDLKEKSLTRLLNGCIKFVAGGKDYSRNTSTNSPAGTIPTENRMALVEAEFIQKYYKSGDNNHSVKDPTGALRTKDSHYIIQPTFINCNFSSGQTHRSIEDASGSLTTVPKYNVTNCFLLNPQWKNAGADMDSPSFTLIARMDKAPPYLVTTEQGNLAIEVYDTDSPATVALKNFMAMYGIAAIYMRLLSIPELLKIQGFPVDYFDEMVKRGEITKTDMKKFIGNAVQVDMAEAIATAVARTFNELRNQQTA